MNQLPIFPVYASADGEFPTLRDAALFLGEVTANPSHKLERRPGQKPIMRVYDRRAKRLCAGNYERSTLLSEVRARPAKAPASVTSMYGRLHGTKVAAPEQVADLAIDAIARYLEESWDPAASHVMFHSSGYDTRLVAAILRQLAAQRGREWLGKVKFVCFEPELSLAHSIWLHGDWPSDSWEPIYPHHKPEDYYARCLDFRAVGRHLSEAERFWGGPLLTQIGLTERKILTEAPVQGVTALFGDETLKWSRCRWSSVAWFLSCWFFDNPGIFPSRPDCKFIAPFVSAPWFDVLTEFRVPLAIDDFKLLMIKRVDPDLADLERFPNWRFEAKHVRARNIAKEATRRGLPKKDVQPFIDQQKISSATSAMMERDYAESWYAQTFGPSKLSFASDRAFRYWDDRNTHYMQAAIYEHLLDEGVEVKR
jgi:hypothetical protein